MTHELKHIIEVAHQNNHLKYVLATVVALDGSSYRKPGVQMLLCEDGSMTGAVSGGCVEKEVLFQSQSVFETGIPKVMTYNGSYRLGCEGILYLLLEPFAVSTSAYHILKEHFKNRKSITLTSCFEKKYGVNHKFGSFLTFSDQQKIFFRNNFVPNEQFDQFRFTFSPIPQLIIIGTEHDAVALCQATSLLGWEVQIIASPRQQKTIEDFPGASKVIFLDPETEFNLTIDHQTAIVLMNHNFARDFHFLLQLQKHDAFYIGILGSTKRRESLMHALIEHDSELCLDFMDHIFSPAGINIGAITPQEIAISILSEIIAVQQNKEVPSLRHQIKNIHL